MKKLTVEAMTLEEALKEAQMRGFRLTSTGIGTHCPIDDLLDELDDASESPVEYTLFHNTIVRIPDAWARDAEVIHLE
ncbi:MAG: hypothetical protein VB099_10685 [Candidatus Limiplasma sp.]|nr:hypothetical protein [Candidatus Limiplasma sp.]